MTIAQPFADDRLVATRFMRPFRTIGNDDVAAVGGKNASLGELYRTLAPLGVLTVNGFAVTAETYRSVLGRNKRERRCRWPLPRRAGSGVASSRKPVTRAGKRPRSILDLTIRDRRNPAAIFIAPPIGLASRSRSEVCEARDV
jgi:phosphoenolpyruvate synthase/pyruvate phosphate dikinase